MQENLFRVAGVPMVENCLSGYNSCIFAYGQVWEMDLRWVLCLFSCYFSCCRCKKFLLQTGSGKTYTMMGEINEEEGYLTEDSGITPRVFDYLFKKIKLVRFSDCTRFCMNGFCTSSMQCPRLLLFWNWIH